MARSVWKGKGSLSSVDAGGVVWDRSRYVLAQDVGKIINVHNGQKFVELLVEDSMVGRLYGEFVATRRMGVGIHLKKKKKR